MQPAGEAFHIHRLGMEEGPYQYSDLQILARNGGIKAETMVRRNGGNWFLARELPGVFSSRSWLVAVLLSGLAGSFALDRFYVGHVGLGILKLLTCGGVGIWTIIDIILFATNRVTDNHGLPLQR